MLAKTKTHLKLSFMTHEGDPTQKNPESKPEDLLFLNGAITVVRRHDDYMAHVTGNTGMWDRGTSVNEAIGALIRTWPDEIAKALQAQSEEAQSEEQS